MSEKPISPLRRRMIEDMSVRNFVRRRGQLKHPPNRAARCPRADLTLFWKILSNFSIDHSRPA
jgi:hypothetical protein